MIALYSRQPNLFRQCGVTLLESLLTIFILAFGILGLAGLAAKMQTVEVESYARSQALILLEDMAARLSGHRAIAANYITTSPLGTELSGGSLVGAMIGGRGCIEQLPGVDPPSYRVTVAWQGLSPILAPSLGCGQGLYGTDDAQRRAIAKVVSVANLGP